MKPIRVADIMVKSIQKSDCIKSSEKTLARGKEMQLSKLIAKMTSVIYLAASVGAFFSADYYRKMADDLFSNAGLTYLAGFITVIIGLLIVIYHNRWAKNWTVLITILGWLALLKGIFLIAFPPISSRSIRAPLYGFGREDIPLRFSLPRALVRLFRLCVSDGS